MLGVLMFTSYSPRWEKDRVGRTLHIECEFLVRSSCRIIFFLLVLESREIAGPTNLRAILADWSEFLYDHRGRIFLFLFYLYIFPRFWVMVDRFVSHITVPWRSLATLLEQRCRKGGGERDRERERKKEKEREKINISGRNEKMQSQWLKISGGGTAPFWVGNKSNRSVWFPTYSSNESESISVRHIAEGIYKKNNKTSNRRCDQIEKGSDRSMRRWKRDLYFRLFFSLCFLSHLAPFFQF